MKVNHANSNNYVPQAKRNNHAIQERVRVACHQLSFHYLPHVLVKYLVVDATKRLNYFPAQYGVSKYYSPRMILHKENLEWEKHCKYCIGDYTQACKDATIKNNNKAQTLDCLYLRPVGND